MKIVEIRRHSMRQKPGADLSPTGHELAQKVGRDLFKPDLVVTSSLTRSKQTATAFGFDKTIENAVLGANPNEMLELVGWPRSFCSYEAAITSNVQVKSFAQQQASAIQDVFDLLQDEEHGLVVGHGLAIELGVLAWLARGTTTHWGECLAYCEGIRIALDGQSRNAELLRLPANVRLMSN